MVMKKIILVLIMLLVTMFSQANAFERLNFGNGFVSDNAGLLSVKDKHIINAFLLDLHKKTTVDLAVVTVRSLQRQHVQDTAMYIAKAFQIGAIGKDNGIVLLIAPREQEVAIYSGYDIDSIIPFRRRKQVIDSYIKSNFESKKISEGIYKAATILAADVSEYYDVKIQGLDYTVVPKMPVSEELKVSLVYTIVSLLLFIFAFLAWIFNNKIRKTRNMNFSFGGKIEYTKNW